MLLLLLLPVLLHVKLEALAMPAVHYAYSTNGVVDYALVDVSIGLPPQPYRLQLVFDAQLYESSSSAHVCGGSGLAPLTLFTSRPFVYSKQMGAIEVGQCGEDVVDLLGARWQSRIAYDPDMAKRLVHHLAPSIDGVWLISPDRCSVPICAWSHFVNTRHVFQTASSPIQDVARDVLEDALGCVFPLQLVDRTQLPPQLGTGIGETTLAAVRIGDDMVSLPKGVAAWRILVAPESHTSFLPRALFRQYFEGRNMYRDDPRDWPPLVLESGCVMSIDSQTMLPLTFAFPGHAPLRERQLQVALHEHIQTGQGDADRFSSIALGHAALGQNALKVHAHTWDNETIVLGGNLLWGNMGLVVVQHESPALALAAYPRRADIGGWDALYLAVLAVLYARWAFSGMWLDALAHRKEKRYAVVLTRQGLLAVPALIAFKLLLGYPLYWPAITRFVSALGPNQHRTTLLSTRAILAVSVAVDLFTALLCLFALSPALAKAVRMLTEALARLVAHRGRPHKVRGWFRDHHHPYVPGTAPMRKAWPPLYARHPRNEQFQWMRPGLAAWFTVFADLVFSTGVWLVAAASDDVLLSDAMSFIVFTLTIYTAVAYTRFLWRARRHDCYKPGALATLGGLTVACVAIVVIVSQLVIRRIVDDYSTAYRGTALDILVALYIMLLFFAAEFMVRHMFAVYRVHVYKAKKDPALA